MDVLFKEPGLLLAGHGIYELDLANDGANDVVLRDHRDLLRNGLTYRAMQWQSQMIPDDPRLVVPRQRYLTSLSIAQKAGSYKVGYAS